jgi:hypothetical protein
MVTVNAVMGQAAGDRLLMNLVESFRTELRSNDLIVRLGGAEFIIALIGMNLDGATGWVQRVRDRLDKHKPESHITVSLAELRPQDSSDDVVSRVVTSLRREQQQLDNPTRGYRWECGDLVVDTATSFVTRSHATLPVTATELKILTTLIRKQGGVASKIELANDTWGYEVDAHLLEVHVHTLRRKLETRGPRMIHTVRGIGYVLRPAAAVQLN